MTLLSGPNISGNEWKYVKECLDTGWVSSVGSYVDKFEKVLSNFTGAKHAIATSSGTTALHVSLILSGLKANEYVIAPNITFIATLNSIIYTGAQPILIDVDKDNWQLDLELLDDFLDSNTYLDQEGFCRHKKDNKIIRAIMPVHVFGNMCDMKKLISISNKYRIKIVEDSTESLGSTFDQQHAGTFGLIGCISFNGNKIITCGGGGMILTNDSDLAIKAKHITTQAKSDSFEYFHDQTGYNYRLVNILAAVGVAQMELLPDFLIKKDEVSKFYCNELRNIGDISFQKISKNVTSNNWLFTIKSNNQKKILSELNSQKLQSRPLWVPMNKLPMHSKFDYISKNDISNDLYGKCFSIPCSTDISLNELEEVSRVIKSVF